MNFTNIDKVRRVSTSDTHLFFWGSIYSQWHMCDFNCTLREDMEPIRFNCAEQYMMAMKAILFQDEEAFVEIMKAETPKEQKDLGKTVRNFREDVWRFASGRIIEQGNFLKFSQNAHLRAEMLSTGDLKFVEGSPHDRIWGVGLRWDDPSIIDPANWQGENRLGEALDWAKARLRDV